MKNLLEDIAEFLEKKGIKHFMNDSYICIIYIIDNKEVDIYINNMIPNNVITFEVKTFFYRTLEWCNNFNNKNIIPRAIYDIKSQKISFYCVYDLNIFPDNYIEEWFDISLYVCLNIIKKELRKNNCVE